MLGQHDSSMCEAVLAGAREHHYLNPFTPSQDRSTVLICLLPDLMQIEKKKSGKVNKPCQGRAPCQSYIIACHPSRRLLLHRRVVTLTCNQVIQVSEDVVPAVEQVPQLLLRQVLPKLLLAGVPVQQAQTQVGGRSHLAHRACAERLHSTQKCSVLVSVSHMGVTQPGSVGGGSHSRGP